MAIMAESSTERCCTRWNCHHPHFPDRWRNWGSESCSCVVKPEFTPGLWSQATRPHHFSYQCLALGLGSKDKRRMNLEDREMSNEKQYHVAAHRICGPRDALPTELRISISCLHSLHQQNFPEWRCPIQKPQATFSYLSPWNVMSLNGDVCVKYTLDF